MIENLKINNKTIIDVSTIIHLQARSNYTCIFTPLKCEVSSRTLKRLENVLNSKDFLRVNRGSLLNMNFIRTINLAIDNAFVLMKTGEVLPISRRKFQNVANRSRHDTRFIVFEEVNNN